MNTNLDPSAATPDHNSATAGSSSTAPVPDKTRRKGMKRMLLAGGAVIVLAVAAWAGWKYWTVWQYEISTNDAYLHADYVTIAPQVSGYLVEIAVQDNQPVRKGDLLARIDPVPYEAAVQQSQAAVAHAQAMIRQFRSELATQPDLIKEAQAMVAVSEAALQFAHENMVRYRIMAQDDAGTVQQAQQALSQYNQTLAQLELHKAAVTAAQRKTETLTAQLSATEAELKQNEAALVQAQFNLARTTLLAPMDGVVGNRALRLGMYVQPGTQLLAIVPLHAVYVKANYKETNLAGIEPGQPVSIYVDTFPDIPVRGVVNSLSPAAGQTFALLPPDNATGNFTKIVQRVPVKILIDPHDKLAGRLRPGMSVTTTVHTRASKIDPQTFEDVTAAGTLDKVPATLAPGPDANPSSGPVEMPPPSIPPER